MAPLNTMAIALAHAAADQAASPSVKELASRILNDRSRIAAELRDASAQHAVGVVSKMTPYQRMTVDWIDGTPGATIDREGVGVGVVPIRARVYVTLAIRLPLRPRTALFRSSLTYGASIATGSHRSSAKLRAPGVQASSGRSLEAAVRFRGHGQPVGWGRPAPSAPENDVGTLEVLVRVEAGGEGADGGSVAGRE